MTTPQQHDQSDFFENLIKSYQVTGEQAANASPSESERYVVSEKESFQLKSLEHDAAQKNHVRDQKWKDHFSQGFIIAFWIFWVLFVAMSVTLIFHWILPIHCHWLSPDQLDKIKTVIVAALATKAISNKTEKL